MRCVKYTSGKPQYEGHMDIVREHMCACLNTYIHKYIYMHVCSYVRTYVKRIASSPTNHMAAENLLTYKSGTVPYMDLIIAGAWDQLFIVILYAVHAITLNKWWRESGRERERESTQRDRGEKEECEQISEQKGSRWPKEWDEAWLQKLGCSTFPLLTPISNYLFIHPSIYLSLGVLPLSPPSFTSLSTYTSTHTISLYPDLLAPPAESFRILADYFHFTLPSPSNESLRCIEGLYCSAHH